MAAPIQRLAQLSAKIFGLLSPEKITRDHLTPLVNAINEITAEDIQFDPKEVEEKDASAKYGVVPPVSYMHLHQDHSFTLAVFVVKSGGVLPLHDHPKMHGLLKVIYGSVKIISYSETEQEPLPPDSVGHRLTRSIRKQVKTVIRHDDIVLSDQDDCCVLTPTTQNIHEIQPLTKYAAFLDILAPPYSNDRDCHYYRELNTTTNSGNIRWLMEIPQPPHYWCDTIKYRGPPLTPFLTPSSMT